MTYKILRSGVTLSPAKILYTQNAISEYFSKAPYRTQSVLTLLQGLLDGRISIHDVNQICLAEDKNKNIWVVDGHRRLTVFKFVELVKNYLGEDFLIPAVIIEVPPEKLDKLRTTRTAGKSVYFTTDCYKSPGCDAWTRIALIVNQFLHLRSSPNRSVEVGIHHIRRHQPEETSETINLELNEGVQKTGPESDFWPYKSRSKRKLEKCQRKEGKDSRMLINPVSGSGEVSVAANSSETSSSGISVSAPRTFILTSTARNVGITLAHHAGAGVFRCHYSTRPAGISSHRSSFSVRPIEASTEVKAPPRFNVNAPAFIPARFVPVTSIQQGAALTENTKSKIKYGVPSAENVTICAQMASVSSSSAACIAPDENPGASYSRTVTIRNPGTTTSSTASGVQCKTATTYPGKTISTLSTQSESSSSNSGQTVQTPGADKFTPSANSQLSACATAFKSELTESLAGIEIDSRKSSVGYSKVLGETGNCKSCPSKSTSANVNDISNANDEAKAILSDKTNENSEENRKETQPQRIRISKCRKLAGPVPLDVQQSDDDAGVQMSDSAENPLLVNNAANAKSAINSNLDAMAKSFEVPLTIDVEDDIPTYEMSDFGFPETDTSQWLYDPTQVEMEFLPPEGLPNIATQMPIITGFVGPQNIGIPSIQIIRHHPPPNIALGIQTQIVNSGPAGQMLTGPAQSAPVYQNRYHINPYMPGNPVNSANFIPNGVTYYNNPVEFNTHGEFKHKAYRNLVRDSIRPTSPIYQAYLNNTVHTQGGMNPTVWNISGAINAMDPNNQGLNQLGAQSCLPQLQYAQASYVPIPFDLSQYYRNGGYQTITYTAMPAMNQQGYQMSGNHDISQQTAGPGYYVANFIPNLNPNQDNFVGGQFQGSVHASNPGQGLVAQNAGQHNAGQTAAQEVSGATNTGEEGAIQCYCPVGNNRGNNDESGKERKSIRGNKKIGRRNYEMGKR